MLLPLHSIVRIRSARRGRRALDQETAVLEEFLAKGRLERNVELVILRLHFQVRLRRTNRLVGRFLVAHLLVLVHLGSP